MTAQIYQIVFEDNEILVIEKLKAFLSQPADERDGEGLFEFIGRHRSQKLFPVHRLDREVLGLMIFGKTRSAAESLIQQFKDREVIKGYEAWVQGRVYKDSENLVHYLKKNPRTNYVTVYPRPTEGAKRAELTYYVLERGESTTKLYVRLFTGRSHQIRVQLAKMGHPIVGDVKYRRQVESGEAASIRLKSVFLSVIHPKSSERVSWALLDDERLQEWNS